MTQPLVADFLREGILDYPGRRYDKNFITNNEVLVDIPDSTPEAINAIEKYLEENNLPSLSERIPVVSYGANVSPGAMTSKFGKYSTEGTNATYQEMHTVPVLYGAIEGSDVVWHGRPGQGGGYFSELYEGDVTKDVQVQVAVGFLTPEQVAVMHTTEGTTYGVSSTEVTFSDGYKMEGIFYGAREASILLDSKGEPISVAGVQRSRAQFETMTPAQALGYTLSSTAVKEALGEKTVDDYVGEGKSMNLREKKARQAIVQSALEAEGKSMQIRHPALDSVDYGRANFISMPRGVQALKTHSDTVQLMEESIARIRPDKDELEKRLAQRRADYPHRTELSHRMATDPAETLRHFATQALSDPARKVALAEAVSAASNRQNDIIDQQERTLNERH